MDRHWTLALVPLWIVAVSVLAGCGGDSAPEGGAEPSHAGHESHGAAAEAQEHAGDGGLEGLAPEDRALAEAQKVCPVSDENLGEMGTPIRMKHGDTVVFLCCKSCVSTFEKDPETYIAKLKK